MPYRGAFARLKLSSLAPAYLPLIPPGAEPTGSVDELLLLRREESFHLRLELGDLR